MRAQPVVSWTCLRQSSQENDMSSKCNISSIIHDLLQTFYIDFGLSYSCSEEKLQKMCENVWKSDDFVWEFTEMYVTI
jgi:hypothetical protein